MARSPAHSPHHSPPPQFDGSPKSSTFKRRSEAVSASLELPNHRSSQPSLFSGAASPVPGRASIQGARRHSRALSQLWSQSPIPIPIEERPPLEEASRQNTRYPSQQQPVPKYSSEALPLRKKCLGTLPKHKLTSLLAVSRQTPLPIQISLPQPQKRKSILVPMMSGHSRSAASFKLPQPTVSCPVSAVQSQNVSRVGGEPADPSETSEVPDLFATSPAARATSKRRSSVAPPPPDFVARNREAAGAISRKVRKSIAGDGRILYHLKDPTPALKALRATTGAFQGLPELAQTKRKEQTNEPSRR